MNSNRWLCSQTDIFYSISASPDLIYNERQEESHILKSPIIMLLWTNAENAY